MNQDILNEIIKQDYSQIVKKTEKFLSDKIAESGSDGIILGLSGGLDSAVIATLCSRILKEQTLALIMPDMAVSPKNETQDALKLIDGIGLEYKLIDINPIVGEYSKYLEPNEFAQGNLRARVRANILYYYANAKNYLVAGSSDKSEWLIGYFTKFGDGASDLLPIISLYKLQVRKIAEYLGVPQEIILKKSSPHLWKDHIAEKEIGVTYEEIDCILYCVIDKGMSAEQTADICSIDIQHVEKILRLNKNSHHKRMESARP